IETRFHGPMEAAGLGTRREWPRALRTGAYPQPLKADGLNLSVTAEKANYNYPSACYYLCPTPVLAPGNAAAVHSASSPQSRDCLRGTRQNNNAGSYRVLAMF
ncbi:hypothetical protein T310_9080, partial [Rasamsonia emersonii CBS 393.64]